jgi:ribosomal RNA-processing protein 1
VLKLWKGLFYALWMCDRAVPQQALCADLAGLVHILPDPTVVPWLRGFWATMAREWSGIDVLRLDKFLLLVRRVLGATLLWMRVRDDDRGREEDKEKPQGKGKSKDNGGKKAKQAVSRWDPKKVDDIVGLFGEWPFVLEDEARAGKEAQEREDEAREDEDEDEENRKQNKVDDKESLSPHYVPVGLKLHVLDIWVDEAERVGLLEVEDDTAQDIVRRITELVNKLEKGTLSMAIRMRSKQSLLDDRLPWNDPGADEDGD